MSDQFIRDMSLEPRILAEYITMNPAVNALMSKLKREMKDDPIINIRLGLIDALTLALEHRQGFKRTLSYENISTIGKDGNHANIQVISAKRLEVVELATHFQQCLDLLQQQLDESVGTDDTVCTFVFNAIMGCCPVIIY